MGRGTGVTGTRASTLTGNSSSGRASRAIVLTVMKKTNRRNTMSIMGAI
jgi:hypothetical protein